MEMSIQSMTASDMNLQRHGPRVHRALLSFSSSANPVGSRFYTSEHEWVEFSEENKAVVGLSNFAQEQLGDIVYVELPAEGDAFEKGEVFANVESCKASGSVYSPVNGTVVSVNEALEEDPGQMVGNAEDSASGFLAIYEIEGDASTEGLMNKEEYDAFVAAQ